MNLQLTATAKQIGNELIDMSAMLDRKMSIWANVSQRPAGLSDTECVGFINQDTGGTGLTMVIDVQAPANEQEAKLRTWCIQSEQDDNQIERHNNIQLDFVVDYAKARELAAKGKDVTRNDIRMLLYDPSTELAHNVVGNQVSTDKDSQQPFGEQYDLSAAELDEQEDIVGKVSNALNMVLLTLKNAATAEIIA